MDHPSATVTDCTDRAVEKMPTLGLFNDVHFSRWARPALRDGTWAPFPRLPTELRVYIWLFCLRRRRMIEIDICAADDEHHTAYPGHVSKPRYYTDRNARGKIVSGRGCTLRVRGPGSYAASLSPLFWVNNEARRAALSFYHVYLPFPGPGAEQVLYLNPEHDVVYVRPQGSRAIPGNLSPSPMTILADFLHDIKAYDCKDPGVTHLALHMDYLHKFFEDTVPLTPAALHPAAARSFTDILGRSLRSVFCVIPFRSGVRAMGEFPARKWHCHFAQTFPLRRRGHATGAFHWLAADPRPGVELDLRQLPLCNDPRRLARCWERLAQAFGITEERRTAWADDGEGEFRFYICPHIAWSGPQPVNGLDGVAGQKEEGWREELEQHLQFEADEWFRQRKWLTEGFGFPNMIPEHGQMMDAGTFRMMQRVPGTAIGIWLFPPGAFQKPTNPGRFCFDVSAVRPGLFLFEM